VGRGREGGGMKVSGEDLGKKHRVGQ